MAFDVLFKICQLLLVSFEDFFLKIGIYALIFVVFWVHGLSVFENFQFLLNKSELMLVASQIHVQYVIDEVW